MKRVKYFQQLFFLLLLGVSLCAVQACGDDEDDERVDDPNQEQTTPGGDNGGETTPSDSISSPTDDPVLPADSIVDSPDTPLIPNDSVVSANHEAVDLGLSVKWAAYNVGATSPEEYGDYFAWGEVEPKSSYDSVNSLTYGLSISELESRGIIGSDGNLTAAYDAATANWGDNWRMPTLDEIKELLDECNWTWTTQNGVNGRKVTGPNGNSIFLPAAGCRYGTYLLDAGSVGVYWSATPYSGSSEAFYLLFDSNLYVWNNNLHYIGYTVRPVSDELLSGSEK